jgi:hypothetical protein
MDSEALNQRVAAVEAALNRSAAQQAALVHELDRLAEHLVGESAPELQAAKAKIQALITQVAPERHDVVVYVEVYCHVTHI